MPIPVSLFSRLFACFAGKFRRSLSVFFRVFRGLNRLGEAASFDLAALDHG